MSEKENKLPLIKDLETTEEISETLDKEEMEEAELKDPNPEEIEKRNEVEHEEGEKAKQTEHVEEMNKKREELREKKGREEILDEIERKTDKKGFCPNCGAYVGAYYACTWCKTKMPHGNRLRTTQVLTVVLMIAGLVSLGFYAQIDPAPKVNIGDIGPTYSYGIITIEGNVTNIDYRVASDGSWRTLIFTVEDSTGSIDVKAYSDATNEIIESKNTPALGDQVSVRGSIYIRGDDLYVQIESTLSVVIERPTILETTAQELLSMYNAGETYFIGHRVKINGTVTQLGGGGVHLDLDEELRVYFPDYVREFSPDRTLTAIPGDFVEVVGYVEVYYGNLQIVPSSLYDITILGEGGEVL